jgi:hypothetical protein
MGYHSQYLKTKKGSRKKRWVRRRAKRKKERKRRINNDGAHREQNKQLKEG